MPRILVPDHLKVTVGESALASLAASVSGVLVEVPSSAGSPSSPAASRPATATPCSGYLVGTQAQGRGPVRRVAARGAGGSDVQG